MVKNNIRKNDAVLESMNKDDENKPSVADLFCGAGGFSEGFRQKDFSLVYGLDNWHPAIRTSRYNHPSVVYDERDILTLDFGKLPTHLLNVDVMIASPPCVSFSRSNRMGKADKDDGIELIKKTLGLIAWLKEHGELKYWVIENVPNTKKHIRDKYDWDYLGLPDKGTTLEVKRKEIYNSEDFGVPQRRRRLFFGDFPNPKPLGSDNKITVEDVFSKLQNPLKGRDGSEVDLIEDPCYPSLSLKKEDLTDHFYDTTIREERWRRAKDLKEDHGYMGRMTFPDETDRPSRTVMATRSASSRESMIFGVNVNGKEGYEKYRLPTVREIATFMSFPITYQFQGRTETEKYRLVGNAVPPKVSAVIAESIARKLGHETPESFPHLEPKGDLETDLTGTEPSLKKLGNRRPNFNWHIDYLQDKGFRVDLHSRDSDFEKGDIVWKAVLHKGSGYKHRKEAEYTKKELDVLKGSNISTDINNNVDDIEYRLEKFEEDLSRRFEEDLTSSKRFLDIYVKRYDGLGPRKTLRKMKEMIDEHFPKERFEPIEIENDGIIDMDVERIPVRIVAGMIGLKYIVETVSNNEINACQES